MCMPFAIFPSTHTHTLPPTIWKPQCHPPRKYFTAHRTEIHTKQHNFIDRANAMLEFTMCVCECVPVRPPIVPRTIIINKRTQINTLYKYQGALAVGIRECTCLVVSARTRVVAECWRQITAGVCVCVLTDTRQRRQANSFVRRKKPHTHS